MVLTQGRAGRNRLPHPAPCARAWSALLVPDRGSPYACGAYRAVRAARKKPPLRGSMTTGTDGYPNLLAQRANGGPNGGFLFVLPDDSAQARWLGEPAVHFYNKERPLLALNA